MTPNFDILVLSCFATAMGNSVLTDAETCLDALKTVWHLGNDCSNNEWHGPSMSMGDLCIVRHIHSGVVTYWTPTSLSFKELTPTQVSAWFTRTPEQRALAPFTGELT